MSGEHARKLAKRSLRFGVWKLLTERSEVNAELLDFVRENARSGRKAAGCSSHFTPAAFEGVAYDVTFVRFNHKLEVSAYRSSARLVRLDGRREMMRVNDVFFCQKHRTFNRILEFTHIARPRVTHEHFNRPASKTTNVLAHQTAVMFNKVIRQQHNIRTAFT